jgi:hypothetical protein
VSIDDLNKKKTKKEEKAQMRMEKKLMYDKLRKEKETEKVKVNENQKKEISLSSYDRDNIDTFLNHHQKDHFDMLFTD